MQITQKTKVKQILPFLTTERFNYLLEAVEEYPLDKPIFSMNLGEISDIMLEEDSYITKMLNPKERVFIAFGKLKSYRNQMKQFTDYLQTMQLKLSPEEQAASRGVDLPSFVERMLLDTVKFFHLHSMEEAEKIPLADYLVVLKDQVANTKYQRNYSKIIEQKSKAHRKK